MLVSCKRATYHIRATPSFAAQAKPPKGKLAKAIGAANEIDAFLQKQAEETARKAEAESDEDLSEGSEEAEEESGVSQKKPSAAILKTPAGRTVERMGRMKLRQWEIPSRRATWGLTPSRRLKTQTTNTSGESSTAPSCGWRTGPTP